MTSEHFTEWAKGYVDAMTGEMTAPDDDWQMALMIDQGVGLGPIAARIPGWMANDPNAKEILGRAMGAAATMTVPEHAAFLSSAWTVDVSRRTWNPETDPPPAEHPDRVEIVILTVLSRGGFQQTHTANIVRSPVGPPRLLPWTTFPPGHIASGRLLDALAEAMA